MKHQISSNIPTIRKVFLISFFLISLIACSVLLIQPAARNQSFRQALEVVLHQPEDYGQAISFLKPLAEKDCRVNWQILALAYPIENSPEVENDINKLLACTPDSIDWLLAMVPERYDLARRAAELYPTEPKVWFWLGDLVKETGELDQAKNYFNESVILDPSYALAWCRLGRINEQQGLIDTAEQAYAQCCQNGDPGSNGCYGAGRMAEKLNDIPAAIQYYSRSHWLPALQRADELAGTQ